MSCARYDLALTSLMRSAGPVLSTFVPIPTSSGCLPTNLAGLPPNLPGLLPNLAGLPTNLSDLPTNLLDEIRGLGQRSPPAHVQNVIEKLCSIQEFTKDELAVILNRNKRWVFQSFLNPMIHEGRLEYTLPENPHHPNQAYRTRKQEGTD